MTAARSDTGWRRAGPLSPDAPGLADGLTLQVLVVPSVKGVRSGSPLKGPSGRLSRTCGPPPSSARSGSQARDPSVRPDSSDGAGVGCCGPHLPTEDARALTGWASVQRKAAPRFPQPPRACSQGSAHCAGVRGSEGVRIRKHGQRGPDSRGACRVGRLAGPREPRHPLLHPYLASHAAQDPQAPASGGSCLCPPGLAGLPCAARTGRADSP